MIKKICLLVCLATADSIGAMANIAIAANIQLRQQTITNAINKQIITELPKLLVDMGHENKPLGKTCFLLNTVPNYCVKINPYDRLRGAAILQKTITNSNLDLITLPYQRKYTVSENILAQAAQQNPGIYLHKEFCLAEYVEIDTTKKLTAQQARQLVTLIKETGYADIGLNMRNVIQRHNGKICLIDTERRGIDENRTKWLMQNAIECLLSAEEHITIEAEEYLNNELKIMS